MHCFHMLNICFTSKYPFFAVSSFTKGEHMIPVLNECGTHCAVFGNHDFGKINHSVSLSTDQNYSPKRSNHFVQQFSNPTLIYATLGSLLI
jgi:2',3'-cyclic-nucleotide 2'-phosphodiesterase (5'-nucleotidase family)